MDNGNLDNQGPAVPPDPTNPSTPAEGQQENKDNTAIIDKLMQNNPFVKSGPEAYQEVRTQSVVKSSREEADEKYAQIQAQQQMMAHQQKVAEDVTKASRASLYVLITIIFLVIAGAAVWIIMGVMDASKPPISRKDGSGDEGGIQIEPGNVGNYKCQNSECGKLVEINATQIVIKDGSSYYLYNTETDENVLTTIPEQEYHAITPFIWGEKTYAVLDPETSLSALYSITDNRLVTEFIYDDFYYDIQDEMYTGLSWITNSYIIAKTSGNYRLLSIVNGAEYARGSKGVYVSDDFFFSFDSDGAVRIYNSTGTQFQVINTESTIYTREGFVVVVNNANHSRIAYDQTGKTTSDAEILKYINGIQNDKVFETLDNNPDYHRIPSSK